MQCLLAHRYQNFGEWKVAHQLDTPNDKDFGAWVLDRQVGGGDLGLNSLTVNHHQRNTAPLQQ